MGWAPLFEDLLGKKITITQQKAEGEENGTLYQTSGGKN